MRRVLYLSFLLVAGCARTAPASTDPGAATVVEVVDGDTVVVDIGGRQETLRLIGVDTSTPVSMHPGRNRLPQLPAPAARSPKGPATISHLVRGRGETMMV